MSISALAAGAADPEHGSPAPPPLGFEPNASYDQVIERLREAKRDRAPFSLIRLGNCEGNILAHPEHVTVKSMRASCRIAIGRALDEDELARVQVDMGAAIATADVLGLHSGSTVTPTTRARTMLGPLLEGRPSPLLCRAYINIDLAKRGDLAALLRDEPALGLVSCNDLRQTLVERLNIKRISFYPVPSEAVRVSGAFTPGGQRWHRGMHYPRTYEHLRERLSVVPGQIFLVGAGIFGKAYCGWIKERGGIALDVGSILDGWADQPTRRYLIANAHHYRL